MLTPLKLSVPQFCQLSNGAKTGLDTATWKGLRTGWARTGGPGIGAAKDASVTASNHAGLRVGARRPAILGKSSCPRRTGIAQKEEQALPENWPRAGEAESREGPTLGLLTTLGQARSLPCGHTVALATAPKM